MRRSPRKSQLDYATMEPRLLLAGDVAVVETDNLYIRGDDSSNQIRIVATESGEVLVEGLNNTTINGSTDPFQVTAVTNLNGENGRNASIDLGLRIRTFEGNDRIDIQGLDVNGESIIVTGEGDDLVRFQRSTSRQDFFVNLQDGDDDLRLFQSRARGDLQAITGDGQDNIRVWNSRVWQDALFNSGAHDDTVNIGRVRFTGDNQHVATQGGDDRINFTRNNINAAGVIVDTGSDRDRVIAEMVWENEIHGNVEFHGRGGTDILTREGQNPNSDRFVSEGFENNGGEIVFTHNEPSTEAWEVFDRDEGGRFLAAERVQFDDLTTISSIQFSGTYYSNDVSVQDIFGIEIYEGGLVEDPFQRDFQAPVGDPIASFIVGDGVGEDVTRTDTGEVLANGRNIVRNIFNFEADIVYELEADKSYWVSIHALLSDQDADDARYFQLGQLESDPDIVDQSAQLSGGFNNQGEFIEFWRPSNRWDITLRS